MTARDQLSSGFVTQLAAGFAFVVALLIGAESARAQALTEAELAKKSQNPISSMISLSSRSSRSSRSGSRTAGT